MKNIIKLKLAGILILLILLILASTVKAENVDADMDGIPDADEIQIYGTSPFRPDTDFDGFDDRMEIFGVSSSGEQIPGYLKAPGDNPLVAAYPNLEFSIDNNFTIFLNKEIAFEHRIAESKEYTYGTIVTKTVMHSVGIGGSHTTSMNQDIINKSADISYASSSKNALSSQKDMYSEITVQGREKKSIYGAEANGGIDAGLGARYKPGEGGSVSVGPNAHIGGSVSWSRANIVKDESTANVEKGSSVSVDTHNKKTSYRSFGQTTEKGASYSETFSTTDVVSYSTSVSTVNLHTIGSSEEWAEINTQDTSEWGSLRFNFKVSNTGTEKATNIHNVRFVVKIGNYEKTFPFLNEPGAIINDLPPGESVVYPGAVEIPLRLEEIKAIDNGAPIEISVLDYDCDEKMQAVSAYNRGVLVQIDEGVSGGRENLKTFLVPVEENWTYLDVLKRLNHITLVQNTKRKEINLTLNDGHIHSIDGHPVTNWSWWTARSEDISNKSFLEKPAKRGSKILLTYYQDSDHDFYTDRDELRTGHDPNDPNNHPSPSLAVTPYLVNRNSSSVSLVLKFKNTGDYDAYGIEARMYSLNKSINVTDEFAGGGVRIKPNSSFILNDTLSYNSNILNEIPGSKLDLSSRYVDIESSFGNSISKLIDNNTETTGSCSSGECNIVFEGKNNYWFTGFNKVRIFAKYQGGISVPAYIYKVYVSSNKLDWDEVGYMDKCYEGGNWSEITFSPVNAKYIKLVVNCKNSCGSSNTCSPVLINEIELYGKENQAGTYKIEVLYNDPQGPHRFLLPDVSPKPLTKWVDPTNSTLLRRYDGNVLPDESNMKWIPHGSAEDKNRVNGSYLVIDDPDKCSNSEDCNDNYYTYEIENPSGVPLNSMIETRMKVSQFGRGISFGFKDAFNLKIKNDGIYLKTNCKEEHIYDLNATEFHLYRLEYNHTSNLVRVIIDGKEIYSGQVCSNSASRVAFFGVVNGISSGSVSYWDYVNLRVWTDEYNSYELKPEDMIYEVSLNIQSLNSIEASESEPVNLIYLNPSKEIKDGILYLSTYSENGTLLDSKNISLDFPQGKTKKAFSFAPSNYGSSIVGQNLTLVAVATDYQGVMLAEDANIVKISSPLKINSYSPNESVSINESESQIFVVNAKSASDLTYLWYLNNNLLNNTTENYFELRAAPNYVGNNTLKVIVTDGTFNSTITWSVDIKKINHAPTLEHLEDIYVTEGKDVAISPKASDPDNDSLSFSLISELPFEQDGGTWYWTPEPGDAGDYEVTVVVSDGKLSDNQSFFVHVKKTENSQNENNPISSGGGGGPIPLTNETNKQPKPKLSTIPENQSTPQKTIYQPKTQIQNKAQASLNKTYENPTGLASLEIGKLKLSGMALIGLIVIFIYSLFGKSKAISPFKSLS